MFTFKMNSPHYKIIAMLMAILVSLSPFFQGCTNQTKSSKSASLEGSSGNGEPYTGIVPSKGVYYARKHTFNCASGSLSNSPPEVTHIIEVNEDKSIILTDSCTGSQTTMSAGSIQYSAEGSKYFGYSNEVYEKSETVPEPSQPIPVLICHTQNSAASTSGNIAIVAVQHVLFADYANKLMAVSRIYAQKDLTTGQTSPGGLAPLPIISGTDTFPENSGTPSTTFMNPNTYFLNVSSLSDPASGAHPAGFHGYILDQLVEGLTICINPNFLQP